MKARFFDWTRMELEVEVVTLHFKGTLSQNQWQRVLTLQVHRQLWESDERHGPYTKIFMYKYLQDIFMLIMYPAWTLEHGLKSLFIQLLQYPPLGPPCLPEGFGCYGTVNHKTQAELALFPLLKESWSPGLENTTQLNFYNKGIGVNITPTQP